MPDDKDLNDILADAEIWLRRERPSFSDSAATAWLFAEYVVNLVSRVRAVSGELSRVLVEFDKLSVELFKLRNYVGLDTVLEKIAFEQYPLLPDASLGQDVAFLAHIIDSLRAENEKLRSALRDRELNAVGEK